MWSQSTRRLDAATTAFASLTVGPRSAGEKRGLKAPVNRMIVDITQRIYSGELKPDPADVKLIREAMGM